MIFAQSRLQKGADLVECFEVVEIHIMNIDIFKIFKILKDFQLHLRAAEARLLTYFDARGIIASQY